MAEAGGERNLHGLGAADFRVRENRFERRIGDDEFAAPGRSILSVRGRSGERARAKLQDLARAVAQQDLIAIDAVVFCQRLDQQLGGIIRIAARQPEGVGHRLQRFGRRSVGILVRAQAHDPGSRGRRRGR